MGIVKSYSSCYRHVALGILQFKGESFVTSIHSFQRKIIQVLIWTLFFTFCLAPYGWARRVLIIGGGPMGLHSASLDAILNPDDEIIVLEKRKEMTRDNLLNLDLHHFPQLEHPQYKSFLSELAQAHPAGEGHRGTRIKTNELQNRLKTLALGLKVQLENVEVTTENIKQLVSKYQPDLILGADGAKSASRGIFFPKEPEPKKIVLQHLAIARFEVPNEVKEKSFMNRGLDQMGQKERHHHVFSEVIGDYSEETKSTPISFFVSINHKEYGELIKLYSFSEPFVLGDKPKGPSAQKIAESIDSGIGMFKYKPIQQPKVTGVEIAYYKMDKVYTFYLSDEGKKIPVLILGDAAMGLPYQRSLNAALSLNPDLIQFFSSKKWKRKALHAYNHAFSERAKIEIEQAEKKSQVFKILDLSVKTAGTIASLPGIHHSRKWGAKILTKVFPEKELLPIEVLKLLLNPNEFY